MAKPKPSNSVPADCMPMCSTCSYSKLDKDAGYSFCHRYPPSVVIDSDGTTYTFVPVGDDDFCGEYRRRSN